MLIQFGNTTVWPEWEVDEKTPATFSRVYYIYSGEVVYTDEFERKELEPGQLYIFPSSAPYRLTHNPSNPLCCTFLHLDIFPILINRLIKINMAENNLLYHLIQAISTAIDEGNHFIISALSDAFETYCKQKEIITLPDITVSKILQYISANIHRDIKLKELCKICGYNEQYFIRLFKKNVGISPHQYIISFRLKESMKLLKGTDSINLIALHVGFPDSKSFCRSFKAKFGISPNKFRKYIMYMP